MTAAWSGDDLPLLSAARELHIAVERSGRPQRWVPIWVVSAGGQVYVRTWYRRDTGWYGAAVRLGRARIRVPGLEAGVTVLDVGSTWSAVTSDVDAAYRTKYSDGAGSMVTSAAAATTLRLDRA